MAARESPDSGNNQDSKHDKGPLLGRQTQGSTSYDPSLLFPVPRANARAGLPASVEAATPAGFGEDIWHAYELSWLDEHGMPQMFLGTLAVPATSPNLVESKSLKLYLNSLNSHHFDSADAARSTIEADLSAVAGQAVTLALHAVGSSHFQAAELTGVCLDTLSVRPPASPDMSLLRRRAEDDRVFTHLMRSLCPVTSQPDWATVVIETRGGSVDRGDLLAYLLAYRDHQEFHEQCVERIFGDLVRATQADYLSVHALYTRRGGLDICPWRCSQDLPAPRWRIDRQ